MPPQLSDNEASDVEHSTSSDRVVPIKEGTPATASKKGKAKAVIEETQEAFAIESEKEEGDEDEDDEEAGEDEYVVEAIKSHLVDEESGELRFQIKWEGFEKKSEMTWEPEENLATAKGVVDEYLAKIGGKEHIRSQFEEKKAASKGKKRARASAGATNGTPAKRGKNNGTRARSDSPPAGAKFAHFKPPTGSWEDEVTMIDACEGNRGAVVVYLTWRGGQKTQHPLGQVYKRCPQRMLRFYEEHLVFKKNDGAA